MKHRSLVLVFTVVIAALLLPLNVGAQDPTPLPIISADVEIISGDQAYVSYLAAPDEGGPHPAIVLIHSFRGLEEGYRTMTDQFAAEGFVVLAVGWQTFEQNPSDTTMDQLLRDSVAFLTAREDVDATRIGLTGFCAGGRYTMRYLPLLSDLFAAGVAWYGFPNDGDPSGMDLTGDLADPLLIIHGTADDPSPIEDIYEYAAALDDAGVYFEMKVYYGEPHGFMLQGGQLRTDEVAQDAYQQMVSFFQRKL
ncbi:MAG: dienelactone hydrolase family protein [Anaerolineae bacterium]|nr:dienelactone hydrolase family protein [Anaerolineae bacterium]